MAILSGLILAFISAYFSKLAFLRVGKIAGIKARIKPIKDLGNVHGRLNASWKICSLAVNGQSFLVIDGYLLNFSSLRNSSPRNNLRRIQGSQDISPLLTMSAPMAGFIEILTTKK